MLTLSRVFFPLSQAHRNISGHFAVRAPPFLPEDKILLMNLKGAVIPVYRPAHCTAISHRDTRLFLFYRHSLRVTLRSTRPCFHQPFPYSYLTNPETKTTFNLKNPLCFSFFVLNGLLLCFEVSDLHHLETVAFCQNSCKYQTALK